MLCSTTLAHSFSPLHFRQTCLHILSLCNSHFLQEGLCVHGPIIKLALQHDLYLNNNLLSLYAKCFGVRQARHFFDEMPHKDVVSWTTLLSAHTRNNHHFEALQLFDMMLGSGQCPNQFTLSSALRSCSALGHFQSGAQIHASVVKLGLELNPVLGTTLLDFYTKCDGTVEAHKLLAFVKDGDVVSWTTMISSLVETSKWSEALQLYVKMIEAGVYPNEFTFVKLLGVSSFHGLGMNYGKVLHAQGIASPNVISWTSLVAGFVEHGLEEESLRLFSEMQAAGVQPNSFTLSTILGACSKMKSVIQTKKIHGPCKCGNMHNAYKAFKDINEPDTVSWNGLISGLTSTGHISDALSAFDDMRLSGVKPDSFTFLSLIFACSQGNLLNLGLDYFYSMEKTYEITPKSDHYVCLVDLLSRGGRLEEAMGVIETMPFKPDSVIYKTLLNACNLHGNVPLGEDMARRCLELDPSDPAIYLLLASLYDNAGLPDFGDKTRKLMRERGLRRSPRQCWMEVRNKIYLFSAREKIDKDEINQMLEFLISEIRNRGYPYQENEDKLYHSEQLALAFGVLCLPTMAPVRINKNSLICTHCHSFIMLVTQFFDREIIVRDRKRFHFFKEGQCSCRGGHS
uniref:DYW domain-containing protein n=1 Tax=Cajanus cajan TaxID=3821 RepID=A0A151U679_CAJCA|nr:hypothetical protein KK1_007535 [Cajanus cajan]